MFITDLTCLNIAFLAWLFRRKSQVMVFTLVLTVLSTSLYIVPQKLLAKSFLCILNRVWSYSQCSLGQDLENPVLEPTQYEIAVLLFRLGMSMALFANTDFLFSANVFQHKVPHVVK